MKSKLLLCAGGLLVLVLVFLAASSDNKPDPADAARLNNLGCAYMNQQFFEKALKYFEDAATADPSLPVAKVNQGIALMGLARVDEAKKILDEAAKADPKDPHIWYSLGLLDKNSADAQDGVEDFKRVIAIDDGDADTWYFLGTVYSQLKQFPQAIDAFEHALRLNPLHASAQFGLSRALQQSGNTAQAREHLTRFQYITQNHLGAAMSLAYGDQGKYSLAEESPASALKVPPQIPVKFVDVRKEAGIKVLGDSHSTVAAPAAIVGTDPGACFLDYDNDGKIDLLLPGGDGQGVVLYHNLGAGKFADMTREAGFDPLMPVTGCTAGDYDNDGFADIALLSRGHVSLIHNEKNGSFRDVTQQSGINNQGFAYGLTFVDYDHDGDLDLYVLEAGRLVPTNLNEMWRNNGNGKFTNQADQTGLRTESLSFAAVGSDYNNDRAVDLVLTGDITLFKNPREGKFVPQPLVPGADKLSFATGVGVLDFDHDGCMDYAFTHAGSPAVTLWRNNHGKSFEQVKLPETNWVRAYGVAAIDYDNDGWVDLVAVGETKEGKGEVRLFRNLGADGFKDVTADVGPDKIQLEQPRAIITGDYDNDGATDLLITQNHGPAVLLRNEGATQNHWLKLSLKGLNDNKSAIGTKVEVFSGGNRQKFEIYGSNGYLGQNSPYLTVGLGDAKEADIVRMLWPTGVLQDEIHVAGDKQQDILEIDRRGSSCPTLFVWNGERYQFVADMLGAGVVGHWVGPGQRDIPRPVEYIKIPTGLVREKENLSNTQTACHPERSEGPVQLPASCTDPSPRKTAAQDDEGRLWGRDTRTAPTTNARRPKRVLSFRFMEPLEEAVYLDQVRLLAVDHPADVDVYPNEYFASNPPYPPFKVVVSRDARPPAGAWDDHGHDVLPDLLAHRYFGDFALTQFLGFAKPHTLTLDLGAPYTGGPLWLLLHGEVEYFSANSMYAASQAGIEAISPYVEALVGNDPAGIRREGNNGWKRVIDDMGFPAGGPRTMTANLTGKLPRGTQKIRITTNLQVYWDSIVIDRTLQPATGEIPRRAGEGAVLRDDVASGVSDQPFRLTPVSLAHADLEFHGYPYK